MGLLKLDGRNHPALARYVLTRAASLQQQRTQLQLQPSRCSRGQWLAHHRPRTSAKRLRLRALLLTRALAVLQDALCGCSASPTSSKSCISGGTPQRGDEAPLAKAVFCNVHVLEGSHTCPCAVSMLNHRCRCVHLIASLCLQAAPFST
jgi:hypothetical protein